MIEKNKRHKRIIKFRMMTPAKLLLGFIFVLVFLFMSNNRVEVLASPLTPTSISISGNAIFNNRTISSNEIKIKAQALDDAPAPAQSELYAADTTGAFSFLTTFDKEGTFYYLITQSIPDSIPGYVFDSRKYLAEVEVTKDGSDNLQALVKYYLTNGANLDEYKKNRTTVASCEFLNVYRAVGEIRIPGKVILTGGTLADYTFEFKLEEVRKSGEKTIISRVSSDDTGDFVFPKLEFDESDVGIHKYRVTQLRQSTSLYDAITFDENIYDIEVNVSDNLDGTLKIVKTFSRHEDGTICPSVEFRNVFKDMVRINIDAKVSLTGKNLSKDMFSYTLEDKEGGILPANQVVMNDETGNIVFSAISFDQSDVGSYKYKLTQNRDSLPDVTYDTTEYYIKVSVGIKNGRLYAEKKYYSDLECTNEVANLVFANKYASEVKVTFSGNNKLTGFENVESDKKGEYKFVLKNEAGNEIDSVTLKGEGAFSFPTNSSKTYLTFTPDTLLSGGTYLSEKTIKYTISLAGDSTKYPDIKFDNTIYTISVKIYYDASGNLKAEATTDKGLKTDALVFTNTKKTGYFDLSGVVSFDGKSFKTGDFTSRIYRRGEKTAYTLSVPSTGKLSFNHTEVPYLNYTIADVGKTYIYEVNLKSTTNEHASLNTEIYAIQVTINDDGTSVLKPTVDKVIIINKSGEKIGTSYSFTQGKYFAIDNKYIDFSEIRTKGSLDVISNRMYRSYIVFSLEEDGCTYASSRNFYANRSATLTLK